MHLICTFKAYNYPLVIFLLISIQSWNTSREREGGYCIFCGCKCLLKCAFPHNLFSIWVYILFMICEYKLCLYIVSAKLLWNVVASSAIVFCLNKENIDDHKKFTTILNPPKIINDKQAKSLTFLPYKMVGNSNSWI